jgi:hypothetical protein
MIPRFVEKQKRLVGSFLADLLADIAETYHIPYSELCDRYASDDARAPVDRACDGFKKNGEKCTKPCLPGTYLCKRHQYQTYNVRSEHKKPCSDNIKDLSVETVHEDRVDRCGM